MKRNCFVVFVVVVFVVTIASFFFLVGRADMSWQTKGTTTTMITTMKTTTTTTTKTTTAKTTSTTKLSPVEREIFGYAELLPPFASLRFGCSTCAVVIPSGHLLGAGVGNEVDGHECVFRINGAPVEGFEKDVGRRTDFHVMTHSSVNLLPSLHRLNSLPSPRAILIWVVDHLRRTRIKTFQGLVHMCRRLERTACFGSDDLRAQTIRDEFFSETNLDPETKVWLSTGWTAIAVAKIGCVSTTIYGLISDKHCQLHEHKHVPYHYYGSMNISECQYHKMMDSLSHAGHRFTRERKVIGRWAKIHNFTFRAPSWEEG